MKRYIFTYIQYESGNIYDMTKAFIDEYEVDATTKEEAYKEFKNCAYLCMDYIRIINVIELSI